VTGYTWARVVVLIGGQDFRIYNIERDDAIVDRLIEIEHQFWHEHVVPRVPPSPATMADIQKLWPIDNGADVTADEETAAVVRELNALKRKLKGLTDHKTALEMDIKNAMQEATRLVDSAGNPLATWKAQTSKRLDTNAVKAALGDELPQYQTSTTTRVLRLTNTEN
jgi:predicted phage-related endonuclease